MIHFISKSQRLVRLSLCVIVMLFLINPAWAQTPQFPILPQGVLSPPGFDDTLNDCSGMGQHTQYLINTGDESLNFDVIMISGFYEDFEHGLENWIFDGAWGISDQAYEGNGALSDSPDGYYANDAYQFIEMKNPVTVYDPDNFSLSYMLYTQTECCCDELVTYLQVNGGDWIYIDSKACNQEYTDEYYYLSSLVESGDQIKIRFEFFSDYSVNYDGIYLDEFYISGVYLFPPWISVNPATGIIPAGDSVALQIEINPAGLPSGDHLSEFYIDYNNPANPFLFSWVSLHLSGSPLLETETQTLIFDPTPLHAESTLPLWIFNAGCDTLHIDSIISTGNFSLLFQISTIYPYDSLQLPVIFNPQAVGTLNGQLSIYSDGGNMSINLEGEGLPAPEIHISPDTLAITLNSCNETGIIPFTIANYGLIPLEIQQISTPGIITPPLCQPQSYPYSDHLGIARVAFNTIDHSSSDEGEGYTDLFDSVKTVVMPGSFYTVTVVTGYGDASVRVWIDYNNDGDFNLDNELLISNIPDPGESVPSDGPMEFTVERSIRIPYSCVQGTWLRLRVGSNYWGNIPMPCENTYGQFEDYAVMVNQPIMAGQSLPVIIPGDSTELFLNVAAQGLPEGEHLLALNISTNDPANPNLVVPVYLTVNGEPEVNFTDTAFFFYSVPEHSLATDTLNFINLSCGRMIIDEIHNHLEAFSISAPSPTIEGFDSLKMCIRFLPQDPGNYTDTLTVITNAGIYYFLLSGSSVSAAHLSVDTNQFLVELPACQDTLFQTITLSNPGSDTLFYVINQTLDFLEDFEGELSGWTHQVFGQDSLWHVTDINSHSPDHCLYSGIDLQGNYSTAHAIDHAILTPFIDLRDLGDYDNTYLSFWHYYNTQYWSDLCKVQITADSGATWQWLNGNGYSGDISEWEEEIINISHFNGNVIRVRFYFYTNATNNNYPGWFIDDVSISSSRGSDQWLKISPVSGSIIPGGSQTVTLTFSHTLIEAGTYNTTFSIYSNAPANPDLNINCTLLALGQAQLSIADTALFFPEVMQNAVTELSYPIYNSGCDTLYVYEMESNLPDFYFWPYNTFYLLPGDSLEVDASFSPDILGPYSGFITFITNIGEVSIPVYGNTTAAPYMIVDPSSAINLFTGSCSDSTQYTLSISNTGSVDLTWQAQVHFIPPHMALRNPRVQMPSTLPGTQWTIEAWANPDTIMAGRKTVYGGVGSNIGNCSNWALTLEDGVWGLMIKPQSGSCTQTVSSGVNAVKGNWVHLAGVCNGDSAWIYVNGILCGSAAVFTNYSGYQWSFIGGEYQSSSNNFKGIIDEVRLWNFPRSQEDIQATMHHALSGNETGLKGYWDMNETYATGGNYILDKSPMHRNGYILSGLRISTSTPVDNFLTITPASGTLAPGSDVTPVLTVYSDYLNSGVTNAYLNITSNDPLHSFVFIPCTITVTGEPLIETTESCLIFTDILQYTTQTQTLTVYNRGCDTLFLTGSYCSSGYFMVEPQTTMILPQQQQSLSITYTPEYAGSYSDTLYIPNNDSLIKVCLQGTALPAPLLNIQPDFVDLTLGCEFTSQGEIKLYNEGLAELTYTVQASPVTWLQHAAPTGILGPGDSLVLDLTVSRLGLNAGTYQSSVGILSNDPRYNLLSVPVTMVLHADDNSISLGNDSTICEGNTLNLNAGNIFTQYTWNTGNNGPVQEVSTSGLYSVTVTDNLGCQYNDSILIEVVQGISIEMPDDTLLCTGESITIKPVITGGIPPVPEIVVLGTGNSFQFTTGPNPFSTSFRKKRTLMLYTAGELLTAGLSKGYLHQISFNIGYAGLIPLNGFTIKLGFTSSAALSGFVEGLHPVFSTNSYYPVTGWNDFSFTDTVFWDGQQHLLVEICFENSYYGGSSSVQISNIAGSTWSKYCDNCGTGCYLTGGSLFGSRANIRLSSLGLINEYEWTGPGMFHSQNDQISLTNIQLPEQGTYYLMVGNANACNGNDSIMINVTQSPVIELPTADTIISGNSTQLECIPVSGVAPFSYTWNPVEGLNDPFTGNPVASPLFSKNYSVHVTGSNNCSATDSIHIFVYQLYTLNGYLNYYNMTGTPLEGTQIFLKNSTEQVLDSTLAVTDGFFEFDSLINGTYHFAISPLQPWGGTNATDALEVSRHIVHYITLDALKQKAADVNASGTISAADPLLILKRTVGLLDSFPAADWTINHPPLIINENDLTVYVTALCMGDVNSSYIPGNKSQPSLDLIRAGSILPNIDGNYEISFKTTSSLNLGAFTIGFRFPESVKRILDVSSAINGLVFHSKNPQSLWVAWQDTRGFDLETGKELMSVTLELNGNAQPEDFIIIPEAESEIADRYTQVISPVLLQYPSPQEGNFNEIFDVAVIPNPNAGVFRFEFVTPESGIITIEICDIYGNIVKSSHSEQLNKGINYLDYYAEYLQDGVYLCRLKLHGEHLSSVKIIRLIITH
ncbi:MAG: LamG-like jellyroll fold domain-containing protein [Bacteroidales bacterium]